MQAIRTPLILTLTALLSAPAAAIAADKISLHPELATAGFEQRWSWGEAQARGAQRGAWSGYAIDMWTRPDVYFIAGGVRIHGRGGLQARGQALAEVLGAAVPMPGAVTPVNSDAPERVLRSIAVLVKLDADGKTSEVDITDLSFPVDLEGRPLAWLGTASADESFRLLTRLFGEAAGLFDSATSRAREDLVEVIGLHDRDEAVDFLARVLDSRAATAVREEAAEALAEQSSPRAIEILLRTAHHDSSIGVREEAVEALGESPLATAEAALITLASGRGDHRVRAEAVEVLGERATPQARATIEELLWNDRDVEVQEEALDAIAEMPDAVSLPILIDVARNHPLAAVREEAVDCLVEKASERVVGTLEEVVYNDNSASVREEALDALGELPGGEGLAILVKVAGTHPDTSLRDEALDVLVDLGESDPRARRALRVLGSS